MLSDQFDPSDSRSSSSFKVRWTPEEDEKLAELYKKFNGNWNEIIPKFPNRSKYAIINRWQIFIKKKNQLVYGTDEVSNENSSQKGRLYKWKSEDDDLLKNLLITYGLNWVEIQKHFPDRSANSISSHWYVTLKPTLSASLIKKIENQSTSNKTKKDAESSRSGELNNSNLEANQQEFKENDQSSQQNLKDEQIEIQEDSQEDQISNYYADISAHEEETSETPIENLTNNNSSKEE